MEIYSRTQPCIRNVYVIQDKHVFDIYILRDKHELLQDRERVCCLLVLNLVSSTLPCIRQPGPRLIIITRRNYYKTNMNEGFLMHTDTS